VTCPFCEGSHPAGTARCPVTGAILPRRKTPSLSSRPAYVFGDAGARPIDLVNVVLRLPSGELIRVAPGASVPLGREASPIASVCADNVSRHHAEVRAESDRVVVVDAGSTNGTFVNDRRLAPGVAQTILPGDTIRLGTDPPMLLQVVAASE
jgi:hypothetical protein